MKYLKYFENNNIIEQQPFYISNNTLYISDNIAKLLTPTYNELKKLYKNNPTASDYQFKKNVDFLNNEKDENGRNKVREVYTNITVRWRNMYAMSIIIKYRGSGNTIDNKFGKFNYYITGNSGDSEMHGKNMKRATRECNYNLMIKLYPIVKYIDNFMKIFESKEKGFLEIIKDSLNKDIMLAKYGVPKELKKYFKGAEEAIINSDKYNI